MGAQPKCRSLTFRQADQEPELSRSQPNSAILLVCSFLIEWTRTKLRGQPADDCSGADHKLRRSLTACGKEVAQIPLGVVVSNDPHPLGHMTLKPTSKSNQKISFRLNCSSRISIPLRVVLMVPKLPVPTIGTWSLPTLLLPNVRLGSPKLG